MKKYSLILKKIWYLYLVLLFVFVVIKFNGSFIRLADKIAATPFGTNYNLVPFRTIGVQIEHVSEGWAWINLLGNVIPFSPFGVMLPLVYPRFKPFVKVFISGLFFILLIEFFQFITRLGSFDVDDIILNMAGVCIGYLGMKVFICVITYFSLLP